MGLIYMPSETEVSQKLPVHFSAPKRFGDLKVPAFLSRADQRENDSVAIEILYLVDRSH